MANAAERLTQRIREIAQLGATSAVLEWDTETYMPRKGIAGRSEQMALLAGLAHERRTSRELGELLDALDGRIEDPVLATNVRETRRIYTRALKIPASLVRELARVTTLAKGSWTQARAESDFSIFAPHLKAIVDLKRQEADCLGFTGERFDALIDEYEPGTTAADLVTLFTSLRKALAPFVQKIADAPDKPDGSIVRRHFPRDAQERFCRFLAGEIGFDWDAGRLDVSTHPFCNGMNPGDVRLTTRYAENYFGTSVFGVIHEAGHGLYEQGFDPAHSYTPMASGVSLGIHESQARLWENAIGRSLPFWERYYPDCQQAFPQALGSVAMIDFYRAINTVSPSCIRVEADEVTYNLHIILRFEIERTLLNEQIEVADIPEAWNAKMQELLGITPSNDAEGCLQDLHWAVGVLTYFPSYALGNLYALQFLAAAKRALPGLEDAVRQGDHSVLLGWLRENIHKHGQRYLAGELVERVTGSPLSIQPFMDYVREKFSPIYGL